MDSKKVLYFLKVLAENTDGYSEELKNLFAHALDDNDDIQGLKRCLTDYDFFGSIGNDLRFDSEKIIKDIYDNPLNALNSLNQAQYYTGNILKEAQVCQNRLLSPYPFEDDIVVIKNPERFKAAYRQIASSCVYLIMVYSGVERLNNLVWNDDFGIIQTIKTVNSSFLPTLETIKKPDFSWVIRKRKLGRKAFFGDEAFFLSYENPQTVESMCSTLDKEPMGTHSFLNITAYKTKENGVPYCWGIGNLVSASPRTALSYLQSDIVTSLRSPNGTELREVTPTPLNCIRRLTDGKRYCITPESLASGLNQWLAGHEILRRSGFHKCLICGEPVAPGELICPTHFS